MEENDVSKEQIRESALVYLARREHSRAELRQKLTRKFGACTAINDVVEELESDGYLSDRRYADSMARIRSGRGYGPLRVKAELGAKGVKSDTAEQAIESQQADWTDIARHALTKRFGTPGEGDRETRAKQYRFLAQRGFSSEQIRAALDEYYREE